MVGSRYVFACSALPFSFKSHLFLHIGHRLCWCRDDPGLPSPENVHCWSIHFARCFWYGFMFFMHIVHRKLMHSKALATVSCLHSVVGFGFLLFAPAMYTKLGYKKGDTVLVCLAIGLGCPAWVSFLSSVLFLFTRIVIPCSFFSPFLLWKYGKRIRMSSTDACINWESTVIMFNQLHQVRSFCSFWAFLMRVCLILEADQKRRETLMAAGMEWPGAFKCVQAAEAAEAALSLWSCDLRVSPKVSLFFFVFCYFFFSLLFSSIQTELGVKWAMRLQYNATILPPPISHTPHTPNVDFGTNIIPERVDKHPSMNTNRPKFSG